MATREYISLATVEFLPKFIIRYIIDVSKSYIHSMNYDGLWNICLYNGSKNCWFIALVYKYEIVARYMWEDTLIQKLQLLFHFQLNETFPFCNFNPEIY